MPGSLDDDPSRRGLQSYMQYSHLGVQFAVTIGVFVGAGVWADGRWGTSPIFLLLGLALGFTGAFISLYRAVYPPKRNDAQK